LRSCDPEHLVLVLLEGSGRPCSLVLSLTELLCADLRCAGLDDLSECLPECSGGLDDDGEDKAPLRLSLRLNLLDLLDLLALGRVASFL
jgi:hypothetical protein